MRCAEEDAHKYDRCGCLCKPEKCEIEVEVTYEMV
jgi:hypothetical protein